MVKNKFLLSTVKNLVIMGSVPPIESIICINLFITANGKFIPTISTKDLLNLFRPYGSHPQPTGVREVKTPPLSYKIIANQSHSHVGNQVTELHRLWNSNLLRLTIIQSKPVQKSFFYWLVSLKIPEYLKVILHSEINLFLRGVYDSIKNWKALTN